MSVIINYALVVAKDFSMAKEDDNERQFLFLPHLSLFGQLAKVYSQHHKKEVIEPPSDHKI